MREHSSKDKICTRTFEQGQNFARTLNIRGTINILLNFISIAFNFQNELCCTRATALKDEILINWCFSERFEKCKILKVQFRGSMPPDPPDETRACGAHSANKLTQTCELCVCPCAPHYFNKSKMASRKRKLGLYHTSTPGKPLPYSISDSQSVYTAAFKSLGLRPSV